MATSEFSSFGELLRRYREVADLTQEALAERAHLSIRGISDLERGVRRVPRPDTLMLLITALGLSGQARAELEAAARRVIEPSAPQPSPGRRFRPGTLPLVGRARERAALERHVGGAGPPVLLLAGEPGIGKTRLLKHALEYAGRAGLRALVGGCQRQGDQMPYAPLLETLQSYLRSQSAARLRTELHGCAWLVRLLPELA
ncbi:MAG TPA: helix-turn-helix domain-containing protein, partial [Chloroflexota bacterium]|nr:helix-turn-helix domain-containing protein [Chloroflexota bacterium]